MIGNIKCPVCGGNIVKHRKSFSCENWKDEDGKCSFAIWKQSFGAMFNVEDVVHLLQGESIEKTNISRAGNSYQALWKLNEEYKAWFKYISPDNVATVRN